MRPASLMLPLVFVSACGEGLASDCEATVDPDVHTRLRVVWNAPAGDASWVEFSAEGRPALIAPGTTDGDAHSAVLVGAGPLEEVAWTAVTERGGHRWTCSGETSTGNLEAALPSFDIGAWNPEIASPERFLLGVLVGVDDGVLFLIDREGRLAWWQATEPGLKPTDIQPVGGADVTWNVFDSDFQEDLGELRTMSLTGGEIASRRTALAHHDFEVTPEGYAWLAVDAREWTDPETGDVEMVAGDALVVGTPSGDRTVWSSWDTWEPAREEAWDRPFYAGYLDWTHGNGLTWDDERGTFLYSSNGLHTVIEVATDGAVLATYGDLGPYEALQPYHFMDQHDPSYTADGRVLVSQRSPGEGFTQAVEYEIDEAAGTMRAIWNSGDGPRLRSLWRGQATRLANGNTLVGYGSTGVLQEVTPEGQIAWEIRAGLGYGLGMVRLIDDPQAMFP